MSSRAHAPFALLLLGACATGGLPPAEPLIARHLAEVDAALGLSPPDLESAGASATAAAAAADLRAAAAGGTAAETIARSVGACREAVARLAGRGVTDPLLVELSAARATCRLAATSDALAAREMFDGRD